MKRTLVFRGGALGDFLLTLPALQALSLQHLTLVTRPSYSELLRACGWHHELVNLDSAQLVSLFQADVLPASLRAWLLSFDEIYAWMTDPDGQFTGHLGQLPGVHFTLMNPVVSSTEIHATAQLAEGLKLTPAPLQWPHPPVLRPVQHRLAIHPGSGSLHKNWPPDKWLDFIHHYRQKHPDGSLLIIGGEADEQPLAYLKSALGQDVTGLLWAENLGLPELIQALAHCASYVGHDTGITHLAASLGLPTLVLFGPTNPVIWAPLGEHVQVFRAPDGELCKLTFPPPGLSLFEGTGHR